MDKLTLNQRAAVLSVLLLVVGLLVTVIVLALGQADRNVARQRRAG